MISDTIVSCKFLEDCGAPGPYLCLFGEPSNGLVDTSTKAEGLSVYDLDISAVDIVTCFSF